MLKDFLVTIIAYGYHTKFPVKAIEQSIVDKLGENSVKWEQSGFFDKARKWITYEEVINDPRSIQAKSILGAELASGV